MSDEYGSAARQMDVSLQRLISLIDLSPRSDTVLIALADHGGGGADPKRHDSDHALDRTIPILLAGGSIRSGPVAGPVSLLDVPATVLWALGIPRPVSYVGRPIAGAFQPARAAA
jgi:arylsulfatase A-like enzyme